MALFSRLKVWSPGEIVKSSEMNAEFDNLLTGFAPVRIESIMNSVATMQNMADPGEIGTESTTGNLEGEIQRLRFAIKEMKGVAQWYPTVLDAQTPTPQPVTLASLYSQINGFLGNIMPPGMVAPYLGSTAPSNWLMCNGQAVSRVTYANLYAVVGVIFGAGDGTTTFNVPDYRGLFLRGAITTANVTGSGSVTGSPYNATFVGHGLKTGQRVRWVSGNIGGSGQAPFSFSGTLINVQYVYVVDANTLRFYNNRADAFAGGAGAFNGTGTNSLVIKVAMDYDADIRQGAASGAQASGVGSFQESASISHSHTATTSAALMSAGGANGVNSVSGNYYLNSTSAGSPTTTIFQNITGTGDVGSTVDAFSPEARPVNSAVNYIIRV